MLSALCLTVFTTGCVKTETVIVERRVATLPPKYLYDAEPVPQVPDGIPASERTAYLLEAFASRGDVIKRDRVQADLMDKWVESVRKIFPDAVVQPLDSIEGDTDEPKSADNSNTE